MSKEELIKLIENLPLCDVQYESEHSVSYIAGQCHFREHPLIELEKVLEED